MEHSYIGELRSSEAVKVSTVSLSTKIVEFRDKSFVIDLKLLFLIMDCFLGRFPPRFFTRKLVYFINFPSSSYLILFTLFCYA